MSLQSAVCSLRSAVCGLQSAVCKCHTPILKRVKTMKGSTCLEDLITVAILSVPSTWDIGLLCMNNLVVGT